MFKLVDHIIPAFYILLKKHLLKCLLKMRNLCCINSIERAAESCSLRFYLRCYFLSHSWLATVQDVLQADWHDVWHSPHPPLAALSFNEPQVSVLMYFIPRTSYHAPLNYNGKLLSYYIIGLFNCNALIGI